VSVNLKYVAEPTPAKFHASEKFVRGIMGPIGSGKSVACTLEMFAKAVEQEPYFADEEAKGVRKTRWAAIRNTYPELKSTTIKTFEDWFPPEICQINWSPPITANLRLPLPDGTTVEMEVLFMALDKPNDVKKLLSLELTGVWLNEVREIPKQILDGATGRVGRYPAKRHGGPTWSGIIMDTNPPDDDHWYYTLAEEIKPEGFDFFQQPPALIKLADNTYIPNPEAENIINQPLGYDYWLRQVYGKDEDWINVYVMGLYGSIFEGKPVYPEFNDAIHTAENELEIYRGMPVFLGWDYGLTPACVAVQLSPHGQLRIVREWCTEDMAIREFARDIVKPALANEFNDVMIVSVGDPAGSHRGETEKKSCMDILLDEGIPTEEGPTNEPIARTDSVRFYLKGMDREGNPAFLMSPSCKTLRRGFNGGYKYDRVQIVGEERYKDEACKNKFSHPHDALQYACCKLRYGTKMVRAQPKRVRPRSAAGWT
jgi:hypothetical protein